LHLARDVEQRSVAPSLRPTRGVRRHGVGVRSDARAVKRRLRETALPKMQLVFAREQSLAEQHLRALEAASLVERAAVRDEHVADAIGIAEQDDRLTGDVESGDVAMRARQPGKEIERSAHGRQRELAGIPLARSRK